MIKIIIFLIIIGAAIFLLWQRQPKLNNQQQAQETHSQTTQGNSPQNTLDFSTNPTDTTVVTASPLQLEGKSDNESTILIYSNKQQYVTKTDGDGNFKVQITPSAGLNIYKILTLSKALEQTKEKSLTIYLSKDDIGKQVFAGSVKSIFDTLVTVTTLNGDKNIRTGSATKFTIPKDPKAKEATQSASSIRIGDYVIGTGAGNTPDSISAQTLEVIRDNKPQIVEQVVVGTVTTAPKQSVFVVKSKKGENVELKLGKTPKIQLNGQDAKTTDITKDKNVIIFYSNASDTNTPDLIYMLP